jgi:ubiquinone/menaquinone biosynthesis C-methylase UbiE
VLRPSRSDRTPRRLDRRAGYFFERWTIRDSRQWVCLQATGRTLEVGVGTGLNLQWYPADIELVAVDLDAERLGLAAERAHAMSRAVRVAVADGHRLPFGNDTFETVVCTLTICDVKDRTAVLAEAHRVVQSSGSLLLVDHFEPRWLRGRPATLGARVGFAVAERQRLWAGYFERARLHRH